MTIKNADGNIYLTERAAADADIAGDGQIWVETATPNILKFTDDAGTDATINTAVMQGNVLALHEGLVCKYVTAATVDIDADAVMLRTTGGSAVRVESVNLTVDITASGANGLDTGSEASSTWYYLWVIYNGVTTSGLISLSSTAPTLPAGYNFKGLVGAVYNGTSGDLSSFYQKGRSVSRTLKQSLSAGSATSITAVSLADAVPPIAISVNGYLQGRDNNSGSFTLDIWSDSSGTRGGTRFGSKVSNTSVNSSYFSAFLEVAQTIYYLVADTGEDAWINVKGWEY